MAKQRTPKLRSESSLFVCLKPETKDILRAAAKADRRTMSQLAALYIERCIGEQKRAA